MLLRIAACLTILLLLPFAGAVAEASVKGIEAGGIMRAEGDVAGLSIGNVGAAGSAAGGHLDDLRISAAKAYVLRWTDSGAQIPENGAVPPLGQGGPRQFERIPERGYVENLRLEGGDHDANHLFNILALQNGRLKFHGDSVAEKGLTIRQGNDLCLGSAGLVEAATCPGYQEMRSEPVDAIMPDPALLLDLRSSGKIQFDGGVVTIDVIGVDLGGDLDLPGRTHVGVAGATYEGYFTRLVLVDARISLRVDGGHEQVAWAALESDLDVNGTIGLDGGKGTMPLGGHTVDLATTQSIDGHWLVALSTGQDDVGISVSDPSATTPNALGSNMLVSRMPWLPAALLSFIPLAGVGLTIRRAQAHTTMQEVEAALGAGRFRRAARLAGRVLRSSPLDESAHLGRAIALTKSGRPSRAVAALDSLLQKHRPADGTLHYALGVALFDMGRPDEARAAMAYAVERTPALMGEGSFAPVHDDGGAYS